MPCQPLDRIRLVTNVSVSSNLNILLYICIAIALRITTVAKLDPAIKLFEGSFLGSLKEVDQESRISHQLSWPRTASRYIVHWEIRESMTERDVETIVQRALERHPGEKPRIISDNGPQFIARDFKEFIRLTGVTHVRTSPYYPQSNGKIERWHGSLKRECVRPAAVSSFDAARRRIASYVDHYNNMRLHSALGYVTPADKLTGLEKEIFAERDRKLEEARERRTTVRHGSQEVA